MPEFATRFSEGGTYEIAYKEDHWQGKTYLVIEGILSASTAPPPRASIPQSPPPSPPVRQSTEKDEDIAVLAILKCIQPLQVDTVGIAHALKTCQDAWRMYKSGRRSLKDEMEDEIPEEFR